LGYCDICREEKDEITVPCWLINGTPRLCQECAFSDYHVYEVHGGDTLAVAFCGSIVDGAEKFFPRRTIMKRKDTSVN
jgi:hypothetical protein